MMSGAIYNDFTQFTTLRAEATENPNAAVEEVAAQLESISLQPMLKAMRDATVKSDLLGSSQMDTYESMADQQLAVQLAEQGGIGLARMMVEQMQTRGLLTQAPDATDVEAPMDTGVSTSVTAEPDVTKAFGLAVANAYELRSVD